MGSETPGWGPRMGIAVVIVSIWCCCCHGFNLEPRIAILKEGLPGTYFGFSVAQHQIVTKDRIESTLLVGAPLDRYPTVNDRYSNNEQYYSRGEGRRKPKRRNPRLNPNAVAAAKPSGVLWKCPFTSKHRDCVRVDDIPSANSTQSMIEAGGQWLGVAVHSQGPGKLSFSLLLLV